MAAKVVIDVAAQFTDGVTPSASKAQAAIAKLEQTARRLGHKKIAVALQAVDRASRVVNTVWNTGKRIAGKVWRATVTVLDKATAPIRKVFGLLKSPILQAGAVLGVSFGAADMLKTYADFSSTMSAVAAVSGATSREMSALTAKAKEMGAATKFSASEAGAAMTYMGMAGWKTQDMLSGIEGIMNLAAASGESLATTSDIVTDGLTAFGLSASDSSHFADVLAAASANANTNVSLMGETFKYVGTQAGALGYSIEDVALATGLMANVGLKGSMAGTSLNAIMTRLATNTSGAADTVRALGVEFFNSDGTARKLSDVMDGLRKATAGMTAEQKASFANTVAGMEAQKGLLAILNASEADYNKLADAIHNADGAAARMARIMQDNLSGSIDKFKSTAEGAQLAVMEKLAPHLRRFIDWLAEKIPGIGNTVGNVVDWIGKKVKQATDIIREITGGADFKFGNMGEKFKLLWRGLIVDPLKDWWENGGKDTAITTAGTIGKGLGEILKVELLGIFGLTDLLSGDAGDAGMSIAQSFARGFADGFDFSLVAQKLKDAIGNIWNALPGWGKVLAGGMIGQQVIGGLSTAVLNGMTLYKGAKKFIGSANAGTGLLGKGASIAISLGAGNLPGNASLSAGKLSALGLGSVAGGLMGGATLISGVGDFIKSGKILNNNPQNLQESNAYAASGLAKIGGVAVGAFGGAKLGAAIGAVGGPAGSLIGAGLGGIVGMFAGNIILKHMQAAKFETEEMKNAIKDTNVSAEELARTFDKAVYTNMKDHFGDMELSLSEIQRLSNQIVWGEGENGKLSDYTKFTEATQAVEASLQSLQTAGSQVDRWMWKAGLGVTFDTGEIQAIQTSFDDYMQASKDYVENKHYEFTASVSLLMDVESQEAKTIIGEGDAFYASLQSELDSLSQQLSNTVKISLEGDGIISIEENDAISSFQKQIADIIDKVSDAEQQAQLDLINLKFGNGNLTVDSFDSLMGQMQTTIDERIAASDQAYITASSGIKLTLDAQLKSGEIKNLDEYTTKYQAQISALNEQYAAQIDQLKVDVMDLELGIIGESYQDILGVNAVEKMKNALSQSLSQGMEPIEWTTEDAEKFLGVQNLSAESAGALGKMLDDVAKQLQSLDVNGTLNADLEVETDENVAENLEEKVQNILSAQDLTAEITGQINADWQVSEIGDPGEEILALVSPDGQYTIPFQVLADVGWTVGGDEFTSALIPPVGTQCIPISAEAKLQWENTVVMPEIPKITDPVTVTTPVSSTAVVENASGLDSASLTSQIPAVTETVETTVPVNVNAQYNNVTPFDPAVLNPGESFAASTQVNITANYQSNPFLGRALEDFSIQAAYEFPTMVQVAPNYGVYPKFQGRNSDFGIRSVYTAQTTVSLQVHYATQKDPLPNLTGGIRQARGGIIGKSGAIGFAAGGMVRGGAQLVTVAEEGTPEMIIPLGAQRRERGLYLWEKAGRMLNVPHFANGGIVGTSRTNTESIRQKISDAPQSSSTSAPITVTVGNITIQIEVNGENKDLLSSIENQKEEIANIIGGAIREALADAFINTPALGGKTA